MNAFSGSYLNTIIFDDAVTWIGVSPEDFADETESDRNGVGFSSVWYEEGEEDFGIQLNEYKSGPVPSAVFDADRWLIVLDFPQGVSVYV